MRTGEIHTHPLTETDIEQLRDELAHLKGEIVRLDNQRLLLEGG